MPWSKRLFDLIAASLALVVLSPLILLLGLLVLAAFGPPVIFRQLRPGFKGRPFYIYKLRTMTEARDGNGLLVIGQDNLHFDALHYTINDLTTAGHCLASGKELVTPAREEVILHLDARHMGVGGDDGWMSPVHKEFVIFPGLYRFAFKLKPLTSQDDPAALARVKTEGEF